MHQMRFLKILAICITLFLAPFFAFAQTITEITETTPSEEFTSAQAALERERVNKESQQAFDTFVNDQMKLIPKTEDIRRNSIREYLDIKTYPKNPGPNETVRVTVESYLTDLNKATLIWSLNGKVIQRGVGLKMFSFQNGASGRTTSLTILIITNAGEYITKELTWNPVGVTILWEADTYTPPFYKGKALITPQARIRAIAIPDNAGAQNMLGGGELVYVWKKDGNAVPTASGYGKNSFSFLGPKPYGETNVRVTVSSTDDTVKSEIQLDLPLAKPFILFYEDHPLLGVWQNNTLNTNLKLAKKEFSVSAEPYFFSIEKEEAPTFLYKWSLNSKPIPNIGRGITLRNETGEEGSSALALTMYGLKQTFQSASRSLTIDFADEESARPTF